jgi:hypothetical protein
MRSTETREALFGAEAKIKVVKELRPEKYFSRASFIRKGVRLNMVNTGPYRWGTQAGFSGDRSLP